MTDIKIQSNKSFTLTDNHVHHRENGGFQSEERCIYIIVKTSCLLLALRKSSSILIKALQD